MSSGKRANKDEASERGEGLIRYPSSPPWYFGFESQFFGALAPSPFEAAWLRIRGGLYTTVLFCSVLYYISPSIYAGAGFGERMSLDYISPERRKNIEETNPSG